MKFSGREKKDKEVYRLRPWVKTLYVPKTRINFVFEVKQLLNSDFQSGTEGEDRCERRKRTLAALLGYI